MYQYFKDFALPSSIIHNNMWKAAIFDKFKVFTTPTNYLKKLFVNFGHFGSVIFQKQFFNSISTYFL